VSEATPAAAAGTAPAERVRSESWPAERKVQAGFVLAFICLALVGIAAYLSIQSLRANTGWVDHTHQVLTELDQLLSRVIDAETAERGYVITADEDYLAATRAAADAAGDIERQLLRSTADNPDQQQRLRRLSEVISARLSRLSVVDDTRRTQGFAAAQQLIETGTGKRIHNDLRRQIDEIAALERSLLRQRQRALDRSLALAVLIGITSSGLGTAVVAWAARVNRRDVAKRRRVEAERERVQHDLARQLADMRRLHELSSRLIVLHDLPRMLEEILDAVIELQRAELGNVQLLDRPTATLRIVAQRGFSPAFLEHFRIVDAAEPSACGRALQGKSRVIIEDVEQDPEYRPHLQAAAEAGYRAVQSTPIFGRDGSIMGVLSSHFARPHRPSDRDLQLTDLYMRIAAELIDAAQDAETIRAARDEANRANQTKGRFLATASHDLRQPLQALSMLNGSLRRRIADPEAGQIASQQQQAITVMAGLLNALLDISKLESGTVKPQIAACDLGALFEELGREFAAPAASKGLKLEVAPCQELALTDRLLLGQVLRNLLGNAVRYTRSGSVRLACRGEGDRLRIDVADTGIGIPPEHLRDIFDEFFQIGASPGGAREGHGLGLSIVKRAAQLLQHELRVQSDPGKGSVFSLLVPPAAHGS
jgi:signal transduction histidine kinase/CHASE3 domain sensor protein